MAEKSDKAKGEKRFDIEEDLSKVEFTDVGSKIESGVSVDNPTFALIPASLKNGTIEVDILGRLNGKGPADARAGYFSNLRLTPR